MSNKDKMKNYSQNIFAMMKSHKNNKKENVLKNKQNTLSYFVEIYEIKIPKKD